MQGNFWVCPRESASAAGARSERTIQVKATTRSAREPMTKYIFDIMRLQIVGVKFLFEPTPQGKFMLGVAFSQSKYYTDNLRENILRGIRQKIRRGELSAKAPLGYFNEPRLRTIEPDKKTFAKVKECLGAFATGQYTLTGIQRKMFSVGLVGKTGKPLALASVEHILTNPFYYGHFQYRGEVHTGSHKPMISFSFKISKTIFPPCQRVCRALQTLISAKRWSLVSI